MSLKTNRYAQSTIARVTGNVQLRLKSFAMDKTGEIIRVNVLRVIKFFEEQRLRIPSKFIIFGKRLY